MVQVACQLCGQIHVHTIISVGAAAYQIQVHVVAG